MAHFPCQDKGQNNIIHYLHIGSSGKFKHTCIVSEFASNFLAHQIKKMCEIQSDN